MSLTKMQHYADELDRLMTGYDQGERPERQGVTLQRHQIDVPSAWFPSWLRRSPTTPPTLD